MIRRRRRENDLVRALVDMAVAIEGVDTRMEYGHAREGHEDCWHNGSLEIVQQIVDECPDRRLIQRLVIVLPGQEVSYGDTTNTTDWQRPDST